VYASLGKPSVLGVEPAPPGAIVRLGAWVMSGLGITAMELGI